MADHLAVLNMPVEALKRSHTVTSFEPFTLLSALAVSTERLGLIATASTTFDAPYHIARRFASLDHLSGGRAGWNIVTTSNPDAALNFGLEEHMEHGERYHRARESTTWSPASGTASPMTPSSATPRAGSSSTRRRCMCSATRASTSRCAGRSTSPARCRAGR
ncbi:LLM class flavin-dependent oxidoreductase [Siccirubricoccus deserti]